MELNKSKLYRETPEFWAGAAYSLRWDHEFRTDESGKKYLLVSKDFGNGRFHIMKISNLLDFVDFEFIAERLK